VYKSKGNEWHNNYNKYSHQEINKNAGLGTAKVAKKQKNKKRSFGREKPPKATS
jgi:hypothetical protein